LRFSLRTRRAIAHAALALALTACGGQALPAQPPTTPAQAPAGAAPVVAPTAPEAQAGYPAPTAAAEAGAPTAYPAPPDASNQGAPTAYPPPATAEAPAPATAQPSGQDATAAPSCLPPNQPIAPASQTLPPAAPPISRTVEAAIPRYGYRVVNTYPHDRSAFTEGLQYVDGALYEGTGLNGHSSLRKVELETGTVLQSHELAQAYFGEGIAIFGDKIFQLTWQSHVGFIYDKASFEQVGQFEYPTEGWGLTQDGSRLIMSDGTATLRFLDPDTLEQTGQIEVRDERGPVERLNELEYVRGEVYANVWRTDRLVRIHPQSGQVRAWVDLSGLLSPSDRDRPVDVLNGIAYDPASDRVFVTGKFWPRLFEIELVAR